MALCDKYDVGHPDECWIWKSYFNWGGYGLSTYRQGTTTTAHRVVYESLVGPIPEGLTLDHLCRNKRCVNPRHMEPVTMRVNILRGFGPTAINARKTLCKRGHELSGDNLVKCRLPQRECLACKRLHKRAENARNRARCKAEVKR